MPKFQIEPRQYKNLTFTQQNSSRVNNSEENIF